MPSLLVRNVLNRLPLPTQTRPNRLPQRALPVKKRRVKAGLLPVAVVVSVETAVAAEIAEAIVVVVVVTAEAIVAAAPATVVLAANEE